MQAKSLAWRRRFGGWLFSLLLLSLVPGAPAQAPSPASVTTDAGTIHAITQEYVFA